MPSLKQVRGAMPAAAALAVACITVGLDISLSGVDVDRDDLCPAVLTVILSAWALLDHYYRRFWRESREVKFEHAVEAVATGFRAGAETVLGDGQRGKSGQS